MIPVWRRYVRFNVVGAIGIAVQLAVLWLLAGGLRLNYMLATVLAVEAAVVHNFVWHERYTWADRAGVGLRGACRRLLRFNFTTGAVSMLGNLVFMKLLVGVAGLPVVPANLGSIAACSVINFLLSDRVVFTNSAAPTAPNSRPYWWSDWVHW